MYYLKVATRGAGARAKGSPRQALRYITDGHDARRDPGYSDGELRYIARMGEGWKTELEGGRVPLAGFGELAGLGDEAEMRRRFDEACQARHDRRATTGYRSFTLTVPKEVSLFAEGSREKAREAFHAAAAAALEAIYGGKKYVAVGAVHTRNEAGEVHHHIHVLVAKFATDKATGRVMSISTKSGGSTKDQLRRFKAAWKVAVDREMKERLGLGIEQRAPMTAPTLVLPDGGRLDPLNRESRRQLEKDLAAMVEIPASDGSTPLRFRLTAMDDRIFEVAAGGRGWDARAFSDAFPREARFASRYEKRVETLKAAGYLTAEGRPTRQFRIHFSVRQGVPAPELQRLRLDLASRADRKERRMRSAGVAPPKRPPPDLWGALDRYEAIRRRVERLGLTREDVRRIEKEAARRKPTPERLREIRAAVERQVALAPPRALPATKGIIRAWGDVQGARVKAIYLICAGAVTFRWSVNKVLADKLRDRASRDLFFAKERRIAQIGSGLRPVMPILRFALPIRARRLDQAIARCQRLAASQEIRRLYRKEVDRAWSEWRERHVKVPVAEIKRKAAELVRPAQAAARSAVDRARREIEAADLDRAVAGFERARTALATNERGSVEAIEKWRGRERDLVVAVRRQAAGAGAPTLSAEEYRVARRVGAVGERLAHEHRLARKPLDLPPPLEPFREPLSRLARRAEVIGAKPPLTHDVLDHMNAERAARLLERNRTCPLLAEGTAWAAMKPADARNEIAKLQEQRELWVDRVAMVPPGSDMRAFDWILDRGRAGVEALRKWEPDSLAPLERWCGWETHLARECQLGAKGLPSAATPTERKAWHGAWEIGGPVAEERRVQPLEVPRELEHLKPQLDRIHRRMQALYWSPFARHGFHEWPLKEIEDLVEKHKGSSLLADGLAWTRDEEAKETGKAFSQEIEKHLYYDDRDRREEEYLLRGLMRGRSRDDGPPM